MLGEASKFTCVKGEMAPGVCIVRLQFTALGMFRRTAKFATTLDLQRGRLGGLIADVAGCRLGGLVGFRVFLLRVARLKVYRLAAFKCSVRTNKSQILRRMMALHSLCESRMIPRMTRAFVERSVVRVLCSVRGGFWGFRFRCSSREGALRLC